MPPYHGRPPGAKAAITSNKLLWVTLRYVTCRVLERPFVTEVLLVGSLFIVKACLLFTYISK